MRKLIVKTFHAKAVKDLLKYYELAEGFTDYHDTGVPMGIWADYPDDLLSQSLVFWFAMAQGCGLIEGYELRKA